MQGAAGSCPQCAFQTSVETVLDEAAELAVASQQLFYPVDPSAVREGLRRRRAGLLGCVDQETEQLAGDSGAAVAYERLLVAQRLRDRSRHDALAALADSPPAREEARRARDCVLMESFRYTSAEDLAKAAAKASGQAVAKAAGLLLAERLSVLRGISSDPKPRRGWQDRLAEMAARELPGEGARVPVMA
jgi:hypothetical protein